MPSPKFCTVVRPGVLLRPSKFGGNLTTEFGEIGEKPNFWTLFFFSDFVTQSRIWRQPPKSFTELSGPFYTDNNKATVKISSPQRLPKWRGGMSNITSRDIFAVTGLCHDIRKCRHL